MSDRSRDTPDDGVSGEDDDPSAVDEGTVDEGTVDEESEWRFSVDEVGPDGVTREESSIEPERIDPENALFVALGVLVAVGALLATFL